MKKVFFILLITLQATAQTSFSTNDIAAAAGNDFETLLTNVEYGYNDATIQDCLQKMDFIKSDPKVNKVGNVGNFTARYEKQNAKDVFVYVKFVGKKIAQYNLPLTTQVEIYGDTNSIINFYINYWSRQLNFDDVKKGEAVSTRFLTDVATLSFIDSNTAKITVVSAKLR